MLLCNVMYCFSHAYAYAYAYAYAHAAALNILCSGFFINDEDQLGGAFADPLGANVFSLSMWDRVYQTILRLRGNAVIIGTSGRGSRMTAAGGDVMSCDGRWKMCFAFVHVTVALCHAYHAYHASCVCLSLS